MSMQMKDQLVEAGVLLAVGMSVVFAFLILLIGGIHTIAWFCRKFPSAEVIPYTTTNPDTQNNNIKQPTSVSPQVVTAITAAVHIHRHTTLKS